MTIALHPTTFADATPERPAPKAIIAKAEAEIARRRQLPDLYGRQCIMDLHDIVYAACAVVDGEPADELDTLLADWAEHVDYRTFAAKAHGENAL